MDAFYPDECVENAIDALRIGGPILERSQRCRRRPRYSTQFLDTILSNLRNVVDLCDVESPRASIGHVPQKGQSFLEDDRKH
jgi:hypothetical protein